MGNFFKRLFAGRFTANVSLQAAIFDAMLFSIMIGAGESYMGAFGIYLQGSPVQIGILGTLPPLIGALFQLFGLTLLARGIQRRKIMVVGASLQGLAWLPIALLPLFADYSSHAVLILIALAIIYHGSGNATGPAWNSLIGDLVPEDTRGSYFGFRNQQAGWVTLVSLVLAGVLLHEAKGAGFEAEGFVILFIVAGLARVGSAYWLSLYEDPGTKESPEDYFSLWDFLRRSGSSNFAKFVLFFALYNFSISLVGPYFAMYMLKDLHLSYFEYMSLSCTHLVFQFLTMQNWGRLADQFGSRRMLAMSSLALAVAPLLWMVSSKIWYLALVQAYCGVFWAGYALAAGNFLFDAVSPPKRAQCAAYMTLTNAAFVFAGALLGGLLVSILPADMLITQGLDTPPSIYIKMMLISSLVRFGIVAWALRRFREVREVKTISHSALIFRVTSIRPVSGATFSFVTFFRKRG